MSDDGYTLADTLAALAIVGLSIAGVTTGLSSLSKIHLTTERRSAETAGLKRASVLLTDLFHDAGPFTNRSTVLEGDSLSFAFDCGPGRCSAHLENAIQGARLVVRRAGGVERSVRLEPQNVRFIYFGSSTSGEAWPQTSDDRQRLRSVGLVDEQGDVPLVQAVLWTDQPVRCEFDVVAQDCR